MDFKRRYVQYGERYGFVVYGRSHPGSGGYQPWSILPNYRDGKPLTPRVYHPARRDREIELLGLQGRLI